ncbi:hypothetical protein EV140_1914 [Microcella alkaliphila]|uniref:Minor tail protein n=1 Tax=Microcella alkaliphila TaxID=279828 RepID=A0A4V2FMX6_9MICO|nr:hypothetical protein [Microcella alkaliphila]RZT59309.1 hypothetical protein EV140_1914 [Microcella alkaliphila]
MTVSKGLGTYGDDEGVVTPTDHKLAQLGLIAKAGLTDNTIRPGLFFDGRNNIVVGTAGMSYDVFPFTAVSSRGPGLGAVLFANDGVVNVPTTAAPGANSRIDVVYVWQREFALDGGATAPEIGVLQGTPASSPTAPSLAAFPGAIELARITVPAGITATNSGATITQTSRFTSAAGGVLHVRTAAELPAQAVRNQLAVATTAPSMWKFNGTSWSLLQTEPYRWPDTAARNAETGMRAGDTGYQVDQASTWEFDGSTWIETTRALRYFAGTQSLNNNTQTDLQSNTNTGGFGSTMSPGTNAIVISRAGWYRILATANFATSSTGSRLLEITLNGSVPSPRLAVRAPAAAASALTASGVRFLPAGTVVRAQGFQDSGGTLSVVHTLSVELIRGGTAPS